MKSVKRYTRKLQSILLSVAMIMQLSSPVFTKANTLPEAKQIVRTDVSNVRQPQGFGSVPHIPRTAPGGSAEGKEQAKALAIKYGWEPETVKLKDSDGKEYSYWVRKTEIVPQGEEPSVAGVTRYVRDDGTFVEPDKAPDTILAPTELEDEPPGYFYNEPNAFKEDPTSDTYKYLPKIGYSVVGGFRGYKDSQGRESYFYCINPNATNPQGTYILQPTKFSGQTGYSERPELVYILGVLGENMGFEQQYGRPNYTKAYNTLWEEYHKILYASKSMENEPCTLDPRLTVGEVQKMLHKVLTWNQTTTSVVVDGETIPLQKDRNDSRVIQLPRAYNVSDFYKVVTLGVEYSFNHYTQGMKIGALDKFVGCSDKSRTEVELRTWLGKGFARLIFAHVEAAREKGLLEKKKEKVPLEATIVKKEIVNGWKEVTIELNNTNGADKIEVIIPKGVRLLEPNLTKVKLLEEGTTYVLPLQAMTGNTYSIKVAYDLELAGVESKQVEFVHYQSEMSIGKSWVSIDNYEKDPVTGHWIVKEYARVDTSKLGTDLREGLARGQQILSYSKAVNVIRTKNVVDIVKKVEKPKSTIKTKVVTPEHSSRYEKDDILDIALDKNSQAQLYDDISYEGLLPNKMYDVITEVYEVTTSGARRQGTQVVTGLGKKVISRTNSFMPDSTGIGSIRVDLGKCSLEYNKRYIIYETIKSQNPVFCEEGEEVPTVSHIVEHKDMYDQQQSFRTFLDPGTMSTKLAIKLKGESNYRVAEDGEELVLTKSEAQNIETIVDDIILKNALVVPSGNIFDVETSVVKVQNNQIVATGTRETSLREISEDTVKNAINNRLDAIYWDIKPAVDPGSPSDRHSILVYDANRYPFGTGFTFETGYRYVVFEHVKNKSATDNIMDLSHMDIQDKSQSFLVVDDARNGDIATTVQVGEKLADPTKGLRIDGENATKGVEVTDIISYNNLAKNQRYTLETRLMKIEKGATPVQVGEVVTTKVVTNESGTGTWSIGLGTHQLEPNTKYVIYEKVTSEDKIVPMNGKLIQEVLSHENPDDLSQTIIVGSKGKIQTTVSVDNKSSTNEVSVEAPINRVNSKGVKVKDTIQYTNLFANKEYTITAQLMEITEEIQKSETGEVTTVLKAVEVKSVTKDEVSSNTGNGQWEVDFGNITNLKLEAKYVVYEKVVSKENLESSNLNGINDIQHIVEHKDPEDKAQTFLIGEAVPMLKTTVIANGTLGSDTSEAIAKVSMVTNSLKLQDQISYENLQPNTAYRVTGVLMHIVNDSTQEETGIVKSEVFQTNEFGTGEWILDFGTILGLKSGEKYVVYEIAVSVDNIVDSDGNGQPDSQQEVVHKDPEDKAQTMLVVRENPMGTLKTTVVVGSSTATNTSEAIAFIPLLGGKLPVKDTISYEGLVPNAKYFLKGKLVHVTLGGAVEVPNTSKVVEVTTSPTGAGTWELDFGMVDGLQAREKYVVFEVAESAELQIDNNNDGKADEQHIVKHEDPSDKAQAFVVRRENPIGGELATTVTANGNTATKDLEATAKVTYTETGISVIDLITYKNLVPNTKYQVYGKLAHIKSDGSVEVLESPIVGKTFITSTTGTGTWDLDFGVVPNLVLGEKYVVFEEAMTLDNQVDKNRDGIPDEPHFVEHINPQDKAQTFVVKRDNPTGTLRTTVTANGNQATTGKEATAKVELQGGKVTVSDTVDYEGLVPNETYTLTGTLMHILANGKAEPVTGATATKEVVASATGKGSWILDFTERTDLQIGEKYVVYEVAVSKGNQVDSDGDGKPDTKQEVKHEDPSDKAQTFVVRRENPIGGTIRTTVTANGNQATTGKEATAKVTYENNTVTVSDTIDYEGLVPNATYVVTGKLMHVLADGTVEPVTGAIATKEVVASASGTGQWILEFGEVSGLVLGEKYVVYETAISKEKQIDTNEDGIYKLEHIVSHEDPSDKAQTFVVKRDNPTGTLRTTVTANGEVGSKENEAIAKVTYENNKVTVSDTIDYEGLVPNATYVVTGKLMHVLADGKIEEVAGASKTEDFIADATGNGKWTLSFGEVSGLVLGEKYVVYEVVVSKGNEIDSNGDGKLDTKQEVKHEDPSDKAQTFVVKRDNPTGTLRTTVTANGNQATTGKEATAKVELQGGKVTVSDTVDYEGLVPNETYTLTGTLMHVLADGTIEPVVGATATKEVVASASRTGSWTLDFTERTDLQIGEKYVVYEVAISKGNQVDSDGDGKLDTKQEVKHENPSDKAQTFVVRRENPIGGTIRTTVTANGNQATTGKEATAKVTYENNSVTVSDTIDYEGLVPNATYVVTGKLMHVLADGTVEPVTGATATKEVVASATGTGKWTLEFGEVDGLVLGEKYVVYETAISKEKQIDTNEDGIYELEHIVSHEDPSDKAQTFVVKRDNPTGTLRTTVTANGEVGSKENEATAKVTYENNKVVVSDTIDYEGLVPNATYVVTGKLMHVLADGKVEEVAGASKTEEFVADRTGNGKWTLEFGEVSGLVLGEKYVVYEVAVSKGNEIDSNGDGKLDTKQEVKHEDPSDKAQTFVVKRDNPTGTLRTTVTANGEVGSKENEATAKVTYENNKVAVSDTIDYEGLVPNATYVVTGKLMHVLADGKVEEVAGASKTEEFVADRTGNGKWTLEFGEVSGLVLGEKYVVYEVAVSKGNEIDSNGDGKLDTKQEVKHEDPSDKAQTFVVKRDNPTGTLRTTVTANGNQATAGQEATAKVELQGGKVTVSDTVDYEGLVPNETYTLTGTLMHVLADGTVEPVVGATATKEVVASATGTGSWTLDFTERTDLQIGEKYVVYEVAISKGNQVDSDGDGKLDTKQEVKHEDPSDKAQTFVVKRDNPTGTLRTTVTANGNQATAGQEATAKVTYENNKVVVSDTIDYEGLVPNATYVITGKLMHVLTDGTAEPVTGASATKEVVASATGTGKWTLEFGEVSGLVLGEKYVVYETAISKEKQIDTNEDGIYELEHIVSHEDPSDKAQTFVVKRDNPTGTLRTTVTANGEVGSKENEATAKVTYENNKVVVSDTIDYEGLVPNATYVVTGKLMHVLADGKVEEVAGASKTEEFIADATGIGKWTLSFGEVDGLVLGEKYVVYEVAVSKGNEIDSNGDGKPDAKQEVKHEDPSDKAQTFVVKRDNPTGTLRTTVTANGVDGQETQEAIVKVGTSDSIINVMDTIEYSNLVPNAEYALTGRLMHINADGTEDKEIVIQTQKVVTTVSGSGIWTLDFGGVEGLQVGEKYVVYEFAESVENQIDNTGDSIPDKKHTIAHEDANDKAQSFIIRKSNPKGTLRTTVQANDRVSTEEEEAFVLDTELVDGVHVVDTIYYEGLVPNEVYTVQGTLMKVPAIGEIEQVTGAAIQLELVANDTGSGEWNVDFGTIYDLQVGEKYVVYEVATSVNNLIDVDDDGIYDKLQEVFHKDPSDKAQTIVVKEDKNPKDGTLKTTVSANEMESSELEPVQVITKDEITNVQVKDTVTYTNLVAGQQYVLDATLVHIGENKISVVTGTSIIVTADDTGNGIWEVDFGILEGLKSNEKYVVYEVATSVDNLIDVDHDGVYDEKHIIFHQDPSDKAQTIVIVKEETVTIELNGVLRTTVIAGGQTASSLKPAIVVEKNIDNGVPVIDMVYYEGLAPNETYLLETTLMHIVDGKAEVVEGVTKQQEVVTTNEGIGYWEVNLGNVKGLQIGEKYVVYEKVTSINNLIDSDHDKVFETKHIVVHENPNDVAQTFIIEKPEIPTVPTPPTPEVPVPSIPLLPDPPTPEKPTPPTSVEEKKGTLATTVVAAGQTGSSESEVWVPTEGKVVNTNIEDIVYYSNLVPNTEYILETTLMHIDKNGNATPVAGTTQKQIVVTSDTGNGMWKVDLGMVENLVKDEKYVVYEKATSVDYVFDEDGDGVNETKQVIVHENPEDTAQTILVKSKLEVSFHLKGHILPTEFYLKGQVLPMEEELTLLGNPKEENKKEPHLSLFGKPQPDFGYVEDKNLAPSNKRLPQTGSILSNTALLCIGSMIMLAGGVLLVPRRKENK